MAVADALLVAAPARRGSAWRRRAASCRARSSSSSRASARRGRWRCRRAPGCGSDRAALRDNPPSPTRSPTTSPPPRPPPAPFTLPNDSGAIDAGAEAAGTPGGWALKQWNFLPWEAAPATCGCRPRRAGSTRSAPGGTWPRSGARAARGSPSPCSTPASPTATGARPSCAAPTSASGQFVKGYDFVDNDRVPVDQNGHGTHVAGTIAEKTDNGMGLTGIAYSARLMPVRVLDAQGRGDAAGDRQGDPLRGRPQGAGDQHELQLRLRQEGAGRQRSAARGLRGGRRRRRLGRQPRRRELRLAAGHRAAGDRGRRQHRGRLPRRVLAGRHGHRRAGAGRRHPGRGLPLGLGAADLPGDAAPGHDRPVRHPGQLRRHLDGRRPRRRRPPPWSSPAASSSQA